jgi:hypothetical protein
MSDSARDKAVSAGTVPDDTVPGHPAADEAPGEAVSKDAVSADAVPEDGKPDLDEVKRHFREALDRKNKASSKDSAAASGKGKGKAQVSHGPASTRRSFRRKSG